MATVYERLKGLIVEHLGVDDVSKVTPATSFAEDLNADSLDLVELIMAIEEEFSDTTTKLEISDDDAPKIRTVQDAINHLKEKGIED